MSGQSNDLGRVKPAKENSNAKDGECESIEIIADLTFKSVNTSEEKSNE